MCVVCKRFIIFAHAIESKQNFVITFLYIYEFHNVNYRLTDGYYTGGGSLRDC